MLRRSDLPSCCCPDGQIMWGALKGCRLTVSEKEPGRFAIHKAAADSAVCKGRLKETNRAFLSLASVIRVRSQDSQATAVPAQLVCFQLAQARVAGRSRCVKRTSKLYYQNSFQQSAHVRICLYILLRSGFRATRSKLRCVAKRGDDVTCTARSELVAMCTREHTTLRTPYFWRSDALQ